jgi:predicted small lipoprotein YifL
LRPSTSIRARRALPVAAAIVAALSLAACGSRGPQHFANAEATASSGLYVDAGPVTYQVQISRELNQYNTEDRQYLIGVPKGVAPSTSQMWFAVFLWAKNQTHSVHVTSDHFTITDSQGNTYRPIKLDSAVNTLAWTPQLLRPGTTEPSPDSPASNDLTGGAELLFILDNSVYDNRPLTLHIYPPSGRDAMVQLDL